MQPSRPRRSASKALPKRDRADGKPFDLDRLELFQTLFAALERTELRTREETDFSPESSRNMALFDAYFSNYIEGTIFELEEARAIVWKGEIPAERSADAHDILGNIPNSRRYPRDEPLARIRRALAGPAPNTPWHHHGKPAGHEARYVQGKTRRAGQTYFVAPELVRGTLGKGYEFYRALEHPLAKAMFIVYARCSPEGIGPAHVRIRSRTSGAMPGRPGRPFRLFHVQ